MTKREWTVRRGDGNDWYVDGTSVCLDGSLDREDAHLMAAAPDMLSCLDRFVVTFDAIANNDGFCEMEWEELDALRSERRCAAEVVKRAREGGSV